MSRWSPTCIHLVMKAISIIGVILIIVGVIALASEGITYTKTEKIIAIGPIQATEHHKKTIPLPPIAGGAAVAAGVVLVIVGAKRP